MTYKFGTNLHFEKGDEMWGAVLRKETLSPFGNFFSYLHYLFFVLMAMYYSIMGFIHCSSSIFWWTVVCVFLSRFLDIIVDGCINHWTVWNWQILYEAGIYSKRKLYMGKHLLPPIFNFAHPFPRRYLVDGQKPLRILKTINT